MHIQRITISGFKSYKQKVVVDEFHPGFNIVVGVNGSGKSNLFAAIEFALTLVYKNLKPIERSALLYNNERNSDPAYVEIEFDNSDHKLPVSDDRVVFRRVLASKKDLFYCNGKQLGNAKQFLDTAGFSNPYFIVKQGKVHELAEGSDAFRLKLLEDVAGSTAYDEKIIDFKQSITDGDVKKAEIEELLQSLEDRKTSLGSEASELKEYVKQDGIRRCIEYILNERVQNSTKLNISKCEESRGQLKKDLEPVQKEVQDLNRRQQQLKNDLEIVKGKILAINAKKDAVNDEIPALVQEKERIKNVRRDLEATVAESISSKRVSEKLKELEKSLKKKEEEMKVIKRKLEVAKTNETAKTTALIEEEGKLKAIEGRLAGAGEFGSRKEMQRWTKEIGQDIDKKRNALDKVEGELDHLEKEKGELADQRDVAKSNLDEVQKTIAEFIASSGGSDTGLFQQQRSQGERWKYLNETDNKLSEEMRKRSLIMEQFKKRAGREIVNGWEGIQTVLKEILQNGEDDIVNGYHGLVIENISCDESIDAAIEASAEFKLLHHVVDNHQISMRLLREFNKRKLHGVVHFIPAEEIQVPSIVYPASELYKPLVETINYSPEFEKVAHFVFGGTLLCRTLADATVAAKLHKLNCVTMEGDKVQRLGPMRGGYIEATITKLELQRGKKACDEKCEELYSKKNRIDEQLQNLNKEILKATKEREKTESKKSRLVAEKDATMCLLKSLQEKIKFNELRITQRQKDIDGLKRDLLQLTSRKTNFEKEMQQGNTHSSQDDRQTVLNLRKRVKELVKEKKITFGLKMKCEKAFAIALQNIEHLTEQIEAEKQVILEQPSSQEQSHRLQELSGIIESLSDQIKKKNSEVNKIAKSLPELNAQAGTINSDLEVTKENELQVRKQLSELEKALNRQFTMLMGYQEKLHHTIEVSTTLGTIPANAQKYEKDPSDRLCHKLKKINVSLRKKDGVNQKAVEQYMELTEKLTGFVDRLESLTDEKENLLDLIHDLTGRKGEAILKNFRVLQEQFRGIFCQIVPRGIAELVLYGEDFEIDSKSQDSDHLRQLAGSDAVQGLKIKVNFINKTIPDIRHLLQLSGGQKSVIALCLILAVQKIDPVPFYLFDEVDQALDPQYRGAVTEVIYNMATDFDLQFICTTFRKEFLVQAHKFFGVTYANNGSTIKAVTMEEAQNFVETDSRSGSSGSEAVTSDDSPPDTSSDNNQSGSNDNDDGRLSLNVMVSGQVFSSDSMSDD